MKFVASEKRVFYNGECVCQMVGTLVRQGEFDTKKVR